MLCKRSTGETRAGNAFRIHVRSSQHLPWRKDVCGQLLLNYSPTPIPQTWMMRKKNCGVFPNLCSCAKETNGPAVLPTDPPSCPRGRQRTAQQHREALSEWHAWEGAQNQTAFHQFTQKNRRTNHEHSFYLLETRGLTLSVACTLCERAQANSKTKCWQWKSQKAHNLAL